MLDLVRLRLLRELARRRTMTAVADAFGLTSSAVSQQLATLEREARVALLERIGRGVRLTPEGMRLVEHAETILRAVDAAELDLRTAGETPRGDLSIACFSTYAKVHLLPAVVRVRERWPDVRVIVHELESPDAIDAVRDGRCDLAITFAYNLVPYPDADGLVVHPLTDEPVWLALPLSWTGEREPVDLACLADADWIVGSRQSDDRLLAERACAAAGFAPRIAHAVDDYDLLLRMVAAGLGVGFVPALGLRFPSADTVATRTPGGASLCRRIVALTRSTQVDAPSVRALLAQLAEDV